MTRLMLTYRGASKYYATASSQKGSPPTNSANGGSYLFALILEMASSYLPKPLYTWTLRMELRTVLGALLDSARQILQSQPICPTNADTLKCLTFIGRRGALRRSAQPEHISEIKSKLVAWMSAYTMVPWDPKDEVAYILTNIHYFYLWLMANTFESRYQTDYDPLLSQFENIIRLAERFVFLDRASLKNRTGRRSPSRNQTTGTHIIVTICEIGLRCRDSALRRRCIEILQALNLEGVCDGHFLASWIQSIMEIEESSAMAMNPALLDATSLKCEDIPEEARVLDTLIVQDWDDGVNVHNFYKMAQSRILVAKYQDSLDGDIIIEETVFVVDRAPTVGKAKASAWRSDVKLCRYVHGSSDLDGNASSRPDDVEAGAPDVFAASSAAELPEGAGSVGNLFRSQDAPSFFGSSYFGPQAAAKVIEAPAPDVSSGIRSQPGAGSAHSFRDEGGPFSQIWDLLGILPRRKATVDNLTECFLRELNWSIDAVHPATFREKYEAFWSRKFGFDDFATVDLRWLALLFIVLAYGVLLDGATPRNLETQRELTETSLRFYWASRRAIVIAPSFYGESTDLVRAGILVTRYLIYTRRVTESWLTTSFAMRMSQAQGMHIDGERWRLPRKETETRRRLWSHLYVLDKTIALALGRPFAIVDQQCMVKRASNVWLDDLTDEEADAATEAPRSEPTQAICNLLAHELAVIVGKIQEHCFGLFAVSLQDPDTSLDTSRPYLYWNRLRLHAMYHFARITLHRPYLLRHSITNRYRYSHDVCMSSACSDLALRLKYFGQPLQDRLKWALGPHHLFNGVLVLGVIAVQDPHSPRTHALLEDLDAYCEMQRNDVWVNEFALAESGFHGTNHGSYAGL
ncbi:hypothetical protein PRZ48_011068 [Zasmidium cellare]|uniref:Xylanolytic transcriptional activator regulatory domain-containing protein n=1 Tax=Zasmidium cellare TaxID=395010 RepID=A0ABR0EAE0_ZASCE|nr:hypothetical protein PRZ48_011068 [Zasmidium cellare]